MSHPDSSPAPGPGIPRSPPGTGNPRAPNPPNLTSTFKILTWAFRSLFRNFKTELRKTEPTLFVVFVCTKIYKFITIVIIIIFILITITIIITVIIGSIIIAIVIIVVVSRLT